MAIPVNLYRVTLMFNMNTEGWTEQYYRIADNAKAAADLGGLDAQIVRNRAQQVELYAVRGSNAAGNRDTYTRYPRVTTANAGGPLPAGQPLARDQADTCILVRLLGTAQAGPPPIPPAKRFVFWRGVPDGWVKYLVSTGTVNFPGELVQAIDAYVGLLQDLKFLIKQTTSLTANPWLPVIGTKADMNNPNYTLLAVGTIPPGFVNGSRITFKGIPKRQLPFLSGSYPATTTLVTNELRIHYQSIQSTTPGGMYYRPVDYSTQTIADHEIEDYRSHKTGRPTERFLGRRSSIRVSH